MRPSVFLSIPLALALGGTALAQTASSPGPSGGMAAGSSTSSQATVTLRAQNGSNETGTATMSDTPAGLVVDVKVMPAPASPQPAHIHMGSCSKLDPAPAYPLAAIAKGTDASGQAIGESTTTIPNVTLAKLEAGTYAVNVHKSADEAKTYVACGDVKLANPTGTSK